MNIAHLGLLCTYLRTMEKYSQHDTCVTQVSIIVIYLRQESNLFNLVNFIVIGIFINKNTYIIPTNAYVTYRSVKDTDNVSRHFFLLKVHT